MSDMVLLLICVFGAVAMTMFFLARLLVGGGTDSKLQKRLTQNASSGEQQTSQASVTLSEGIASTLQSIGSSVAQPFMPTTREKQSGMRKKLGEAGIYSPTAVRAM